MELYVELRIEDVNKHVSKVEFRYKNWSNWDHEQRLSLEQGDLSAQALKNVHSQTYCLFLFLSCNISFQSKQDFS